MTRENQEYFSYEPALGHGLPHDPFNAIVGPRPIGWIGSRSVQGVLNIAPYSFFNAFNYIPPIIGFSSIGYKDSVRNIEENGEFTWNLVTRDLLEKMNQTCAPLPPEQSEFGFAGLTPLDSDLISAPRVLESPVTFECQKIGITQLQTKEGEKINSWLIMGEVIRVHIACNLLVNGIYKTELAGHILRGGGPADYFTIGPDQLVKLGRPIL
jgi:flavin reductase (DIM6/NTAB) family NADH-FMN oxidoreductase RutF